MHKLYVYIHFVASAQFSSFAQSCLTPSDPMTAACQASLSITISRSLLKLMSIKSGMPSNHPILCCPLSCLQSFSASGSFPKSQFFASGGQSIGASTSASVLPMNSGLISFRIDWLHFLAVQGTLKILLSTAVLKCQFFGVQPPL